jgi:hypothetical protein
MLSWGLGVQSLMDECLNVFCTNAIYKHTHHGENINMYFMLKWCQNIFVDKIGGKEKQTSKKNLKISWHVNLSWHVMTKM